MIPDAQQSGEPYGGGSFDGNCRVACSSNTHLALAICRHNCPALRGYAHLDMAGPGHRLKPWGASAYFTQQRDYRHIPIHLALTNTPQADAVDTDQPRNNALHPCSSRRLGRDFDRCRSFASHARGTSRCTAYGDGRRARKAGSHVDDAGGRHADRRGAGATHGRSASARAGNADGCLCSALNAREHLPGADGYHADDGAALAAHCRLACRQGAYRYRGTGRAGDAGHDRSAHRCGCHRYRGGALPCHARRACSGRTNSDTGDPCAGDRPSPHHARAGGRDRYGSGDRTGYRVL